ncbi:hypothetical protein BH11MYX1_BH11MYX1_02830 [soil metagenome]
MRLAVIVVTLLALPVGAHAQSAVTVTLSPQGDAVAAGAGLTPMDLASRIKTEVDTAYDTAHVNSFLRSFGDATSFAQRGLGVDYMSLPHNFMIGVGVQVGVSTTDELNFKERPTEGGAAANASVMLGLNLGDWGAPRWTLFANGFYEKGSTDRLDGNITTGGFHIQYRLVEPQVDEGVAKLVRWSGLDLTTGVEFTRWQLGAKQDSITQAYNIDLGNGMTDATTLTSSGKFDLSSTAGTIPIELTTGLRIALLVSLYAGVGFDLTAGKSEVDGDLTGTLTQTSDGTNLGTVHITEKGNNTSSPGQVRGLAGVQVNLWKLKVYAQANVSQVPAASLGVGVRLVL